MKKLILFLVVFLGVSFSDSVSASNNGYKDRHLICSGPSTLSSDNQAYFNWVDVVKLSGDSRVDDISFASCDSKGGKKQIFDTTRDDVEFGFNLNPSFSCALGKDYVDTHGSECFCQNSSLKSIPSLFLTCYKASRDYFSYSINTALKDAEVYTDNEDKSGKIVYNSFHNYINDNTDPALITLDSTETPSVAGASTETEKVIEKADPKIALLTQQVEILKSMIQLLLARLEAMKTI